MHDSCDSFAVISILTLGASRAKLRVAISFGIRRPHFAWERGRVVRTEREARNDSILPDDASRQPALCGRDIRAFSIKFMAPLKVHHYRHLPVVPNLKPVLRKCGAGFVRLSPRTSPSGAVTQHFSSTAAGGAK